jgi:hypothetical protein
MFQSLRHDASDEEKDAQQMASNMFGRARIKSGIIHS